MNNKKVHTGGVALFNGILFSSDYRQVIAQRNNKIIRCKTSEFNKNKSIIDNIPILRGIIGVSSQLNNAAPTFMDSIIERSFYPKLRSDDTKYYW